MIPLRKTASKAVNKKYAYALAITGIAASFLSWAPLFIYRSSFVAIDGRRYFALFDDAMISMRYAWNLSHGFGLVWNPGEYVEGYTNPLMTLVMSVSTLLFDKIGAVLAIHVVGIVLMLVNAYLVMKIADHFFLMESGQYRDLFCVLAFLSGLAYYPLVYWTLMGMETGLLAVLLSASVLFALKYAENHQPTQGFLMSTSVGLAFLTRTDAAIFAVPIFAYAFFGGAKRATLVHMLAFTGPFALAVAGQEAFRLGYYGELVPNTYTLKVDGIPLSTRVENGISFVTPFLREVFVLLLLVGAALVFDFRRSTLLVAGVFAVALGYQVWTGGDAWKHWRFLSPAVPLVLAVGVREILVAVESASRSATFRRYLLRKPILSRRLPGLVVCLLVLAILWYVNSRFVPEITGTSMPFDVEYNVWRIKTAVGVERFTTSNATVGVFSSGIIPYYTGRPGIDFLGKTDRHIARVAPDPSNSQPGHNKHDLEYSIKELRPVYAQGFDTSGQSVVDWAKGEYVKVKYKGVDLNLLKDSEEVRWDDISVAVDAGDAKLETPD